MEDDLNYFLKKEDDLNFLKMDDDLKKIMQPKTIKSKNNDCGTAPGNLVLIYCLIYIRIYDFVANRPDFRDIKYAPLIRKITSRATIFI